MTGNNLKHLSAAITESVELLKPSIAEANSMVCVFVSVDFKHKNIEETLIKGALFSKEKADRILSELAEFFEKKCFSRTPDDFQKFLDFCKDQTAKGENK